jgi:hypothetical protein
MNLKNEFSKWFGPEAPKSYKTWYGKNLAGKLDDINDAYKASFKKSLFDIDVDNISAEISNIKDNISKRRNVKDTTFADYDKRTSNGIPKAVINNYYIKFLENYEKNDTGEDDVEKDSSGIYLSYEKDLQNSLILQAEELFPGYKVFEDNGREYNIHGKKIDLLLEHKTEKNYWL